MNPLSNKKTDSISYRDAIGNVFYPNAKINIGLKITGRLPNGYHALSSFFLEIDLHDELHFEPNSTGEIKFKSSGIPIPGPGLNLCVKAAELLQKKYGQNKGVYIHLGKNIPIGAGLGGGSSDAASALKGIAKLWDIQLTAAEYIQMSAQLGADVPFFINGGFQLAENIGDVLTTIPADPLSDLYILLIMPPINISTAWAFQELKKVLEPDQEGFKFSGFSRPLNWQLFENDFERVILSTYPEIGRIKTDLIGQGAVYASLSGSGSTMFGIFDDRKSAESAAKNFSAYHTFVARPVIPKP